MKNRHAALPDAALQTTSLATVLATASPITAIAPRTVQ
jgi:hypothetical protein